MLTALIRTIILYFLIMAGLRLMGKRQIGELEPSELVLALLISDLAAVPMQDFGIPLINGVLPILTLLSLSMIISVLNLKSIRFRDLICGSPTVIIQEGHVLQNEMRRTRFTVDELIEDMAGHSENYDTPYGFFHDLSYGGCVSGMIGMFVYHSDCKRFYIEHIDDLEAFVEDFEEELGEPIQNKDHQPHYTFTCWLCYEELAYRIARTLYPDTF